MGTGWRRAFCTTTSRETSTAGAGNNPPTPRLRCKTTNIKNKADIAITPKYMNPSSPRSPFSILKNTVLRLSRNSCGVCTHSVKTGLGTAVYTADCSHAFHFPCIASHVRKQGGLICPVCSAVWKDVPLLAIHTRSQEEEETVLAGTPPKRAAANFVPVPGNEEAAEFQGFLVNPISSGDNRDLRNVELTLSPEAAVISEGRDRYTYAVVLKVKAPAHVSAGATRAPIDLVTVLDVSSSMAGAKLGMLKRAMRLVISSLGSADRLSIVAFSAAPRRLLPLTTMTSHGQLEARRIIDGLSCSRGCSVAEGLKEATRALEERRERNPVASIILLSDGEDDDGVPTSNERRGSSHTTRFAHVEIPVHDSHSSDMDAFSKCVSGLLSVVIHDLRIKLVFHPSSTPAEITAVYSGDKDKRPVFLGSDTIRLGDLYAEEEKELLVEIRVPTRRVECRHIILAKCCYKNPTTGEVISARDQFLLVPKLTSVRFSALRNSFIGSRAVAESRRLIEHCELGSAMQLLLSARALLLQSGSESANEYVKGLEAEMAEVQRQRNYRAGRWPES